MLVPLPADLSPADLSPVAMAAASDNWSLSWRLIAPHLGMCRSGTGPGHR
jgi:alcohol dehydrogenase